MMNLLGTMLTVISIAGVALIIEGATGIFTYSRARVLAFLSSPHSERSEECGEERERGPDNEEDT